jgi:hypothetical protein
LFNQGAEDLSGVAMVWTTPTLRQLEAASYSAFVAPWGMIPVAIVALVCATVGFLTLARREKPALLTLAVAFGPYLFFDILFQETATTRYALPLVVPIAYLAIRGLEWLPRRALASLAAALALVMAGIGEQALAGYSRIEAPAFRLLTDMGRAATAMR